MSNINTDAITACRFYIDKLLEDPALGGMKVLLLDSATTRMISMVYSQTQILGKEVYLVEHLGKEHEAMPHLKAAVFVQPTEENFELLMKHFREPKYQEYHLYFTNVVPKSMLTRLGRGDELEIVRSVQEFYADFIPVNPDFFHLGQDSSLMLSSPSKCRSAQANKIFQRNVDGLLSLLLALKRTPSQVRYQQTSGIACRMASEIVSSIERDDIFQFPRMEGPLVLILDRADDPVTPLLTQWTYQAMVHELLGLHYNRVSLKGTYTVLLFFLSFLPCSVSLSQSITAVLHSLTLHDTSLTIILLS
jgi:vacuolar protein sorting-associated protein 45